MVYECKYEYKIAGLYKAPAQVAGEVCAELERSDGGLCAKTLVDASRAENAPLHGEFEWDDAVAGELYREKQAQTLIRNIVVVSQTQKTVEPVRAFVRVSTARSRSEYLSVDVVVNDDALRQQLLLAARRDMEAFCRKYKTLNELAAVIREMEKVG